MAASLDDGEFWLPPKFLSDDDVLMDTSKSALLSARDLFGSDAEHATKPLMPFEFPYGFGFGSGSLGFSSVLSSPVESVVGSTETESDNEEDYLADLTRQMADSTLEDDFRRNGSTFGTVKDIEGWVLSGSPQSTLYPVGTGCGCRQGSSRGSPNGIPRVSSPSPSTTWDLLYAAVGEVARMRLTNEEGFNVNNHGRGLLGPPRKPSPVSVSEKAAPLDVGLHQHQSLSYQKSQPSQFQQLRQQQIMKQQQQSSGGVWVASQQTKGLGQLQQPPPVVHNRGWNNLSARNSRPLGLSASAWPPLQQAAHRQQQRQQCGSGLPAVFQGNPGGKRECAGTGVFLPRRVGAPTETRKKSACSTVLLPARVVQALNLNLEDMGAQPLIQPRFIGGLNPDTDILASRLRNGNQKRSLRQAPGFNSEVRLPQEWTY